MRVYIISNDGITLCREPPAAVNEGEIVVASNAELHAAQLLRGKQDKNTYCLTGECSPDVERCLTAPVPVASLISWRSRGSPSQVLN